jgi:DNA-binding MarR family transcriptional regulator
MIVGVQLTCEDHTVATSPSADPDVTEFAGQLFFRLWRASHTRVAEEFASVGLTPSLFALLNLIASRDGAMQQELSTALGIDPSTVVSLLDDLERNGLAERRPHPRDRRARAVRITAKGRRLRERGRKIAMQVDDEVLRGLTATERRELFRLLRQALEAAPPQPPWSTAEGD